MTDNFPDPNQQTVFQQTPPPWPIPRQARPMWSDQVPAQSPPPQSPPPQTPPSFPAQSPATPPPWPQPAAQQQLPPQAQQPAFQQRWPEPTRSRRNIALVVASVVLFVAAALAGTLYVLADRDHDRAVAELAEHRDDLTAARGQVDTAEEERSAAEAKNADLADENADLTACVEAVQRYLWDGLVDAERDAALTKMFDLCQ